MGHRVAMGPQDLNEVQPIPLSATLESADTRGMRIPGGVLTERRGDGQLEEFT